MTRPCAALAIVLLGLACQTEVPPLPSGRTITGTVTYAGQIHTGYGRPALQVVALAEIPRPDVVKRPHALTILEPASYGAPVAYTLGPLPPYRYRVVARLIDLTNLNIPATEAPTGSWPNICDLLASPTGNVEVTDTAPTTGIDIAVYDRAGAGDPCHQGPPPPVADPQLCPTAGAGTVEARLLLDRPATQIMDPDLLIFAMLTSPTDFPTRFRLTAAADVARTGFPFTLVFNDVPPGSYLVYGCYDVGGTNLTGCAADDFQATFMNMGKLDVAAGKVARVQLDLNTGAGTLTTVEDAAALGCR